MASERFVCANQQCENINRGLHLTRAAADRCGASSKTAQALRVESQRPVAARTIEDLRREWLCGQVDERSLRDCVELADADSRDIDILLDLFSAEEDVPVVIPTGWTIAEYVRAVDTGFDDVRDWAESVCADGDSTEDVDVVVRRELGRSVWLLSHRSDPQQYRVLLTQVH